MDKDFLSDRDCADIVWHDSPIVIAIMDDSGQFIYVNAMAQKFWEYTEDELLQKKWQLLTHPDDMASDLAMHMQLRNGDFESGSYSMCKRYLTKTGRIVWGSITVHLLRDKNGNRLYFLSQVVPLDAMHHTNNKLYDALEEQNNRRKTATEKYSTKAPVGYLTVLDKYRWVVIGVVAILSSVIIFMADLKYNQKRIDDVESKIEELNHKMENYMGEMTKMMKESLQQQKTNGKTTP
jgi:PAS domain S-box-containing protein